MLGLHILNLVASRESPLAYLLHLPVLYNRVLACSKVLNDFLYNVCGSLSFLGLIH